MKISQHGKGNSQSSPGDIKSPIQDKPKEKHAKTHTNQTNKVLTQGKNMKRLKGKEQVTYMGNLICLTDDHSAETLQARREKQDIFKIPKGKNLHPRLLYLVRISFKIDGEVKSFSDKQNLREFSTTNTTNVKWTYVIKKYKRRKKDLQNQPQTTEKVAIETYI